MAESETPQPTVFWVAENPGGRAVVFVRGAYHIAITEEFASMTVAQRLAVERVVRDVGAIGVWVGGQNIEVVSVMTDPD